MPWGAFDVRREIVGRRAELTVLGAALDCVRGDGLCVSISGEPGIGKTRLVEEAVRLAGERGFSVASGRGAEFEREMPFGPVVDALDPLLDAAGSDVLERLGDARIEQLCAVFPALEGPRDGRSAGSPVERYQLHYLIRSMLEGLALERPLLLALDDLHWADPASIELIAHLLRRPPRTAVLPVLAFRSGQAPADLVAALVGAERQGGVWSVEVGSLTRPETDLLLGDSLDEATRAAIFEESGGNPFYCLELGRATRSAVGPGETPTGLGWSAEAALPESVRIAIAQEVELLGPAATDLVRAGAVLGDPFDPSVAGEVAGLALDDALGALDELLLHDVVRMTDSPSGFAFRHPIVRRAVYETAGQRSLLVTHRRAADELARRGARLGARAHHLERCAKPGDEEAIGCLTEAGEAVSFQAPATAARWFGTALRLLPNDGDSGRRLGLLLSRALTLVTAGRLSEGREALAEILELIPSERGSDRAQLTVMLARVNHLLGAHQARDAIELALQETHDPASEALLRLGLTRELWHSGERDDMAVCASRALDAARDSFRPELEVEAAAQLALAEQDRGNTASAIVLLETAERLIAPLSDARVTSRLECLAALGWANYCLQRYHRATEVFDRGRAVAGAGGQACFFVPMSAVRCAARAALGQLADARRDAEAASEAARLLADDQSTLWAGTVRCLVAAAVGDLAEAVAAGDEAVAAADRLGNVLFGAYARCLLGLTRLEAGEAGRARQLIVGGSGGAELPLVDAGSRPYLYALLTDAEIAQGRLEAAEEWVERAEAAAADLGLPGKFADAARAGAALLLARGEATRAASLAVEAVEGYEQVEMRVDVAHCAALAGRAMVRAGDRERGLQWLDRAHRGFSTCGAARRRESVARELRRLGRRLAQDRDRGSAPIGGLGALSPREQEVAELVARGLTNRQVAEQLFVSAKTVDTHLARIFGKLEIGSRTVLAATVERARIQA